MKNSKIGKSGLPICHLIGQDGNIFNLMGLTAKALRQANQQEKIRTMCEKIQACHSYHEALGIISTYVEIR